MEDYLVGRTSCLAVSILGPTLGPLPAQQQRQPQQERQPQQQQGVGDPKWQAAVHANDYSGKDFQLLISVSAMEVGTGDSNRILIFHMIAGRVLCFPLLLSLVFCGRVWFRTRTGTGVLLFEASIPHVFAESVPEYMLVDLF